MDKNNKKNPNTKENKTSTSNRVTESDENIKKEKSGKKKSAFSFLKSFLEKRKEEREKSKNNIDNLKLLEADLIKDKVPVYFEFNRHLIAFFVLLLVSFILIMELFFLLSWWEKNRSIENSYYLQDEILIIQKEKQNLEDRYDEVFAFKDRMSNSFLVLDKHVYWTRFFSFLEQNTLKNVYFKNFNGNIGGSYILPSVTNDVRAISYQSKYFSSDRRSLNVFVSDEEIAEGGIGPSSGFVNFNINLDLDPKIFSDF